MCLAPSGRYTKRFISLIRIGFSEQLFVLARALVVFEWDGDGRLTVPGLGVQARVVVGCGSSRQQVRRLLGRGRRRLGDGWHQGGIFALLPSDDVDAEDENDAEIDEKSDGKDVVPPRRRLDAVQEALVVAILVGRRFFFEVGIAVTRQTLRNEIGL